MRRPSDSYPCLFWQQRSCLLFLIRYCHGICIALLRAWSGGVSPINNKYVVLCKADTRHDTVTHLVLLTISAKLWPWNIAIIKYISTWKSLSRFHLCHYLTSVSLHILTKTGRVQSDLQQIISSSYRSKKQIGSGQSVHRPCAEQCAEPTSTSFAASSWSWASWEKTTYPVSTYEYILDVRQLFLVGGVPKS